MRYVFAFLCVCALGVMPLGGCSGLDIQGDYDPCEGVVCPDDGNECTKDVCVSLGHCGWPVLNGTECTFDGVAGVCAAGECGENRCEGVVCDDGDSCTDDHCDYVDGTCEFTPVFCDDGDACTEDIACDPADGCDFTTPAEDGTICTTEEEALGMCEAGACLGPCDPESEEVLQCPIEGFEDLVCGPGCEFCEFTFENPVSCVIWLD